MNTSPATPGRAARITGHSISRNGGPSPHAELAGQPPLVGRHRVQRGQEQPRAQRQIEEDVGERMPDRP